MLSSRTALFALTFCLLSSRALSQADLPLEVRQDMARQQVVEALKSRQFSDLYDAMDQYRALEKEGAKVPAGLFFAEAEAARSDGNIVRARQALDDYFRVADREDPAYKEALRVYPQLKEKVPEAFWPIVDNMVLVAGGEYDMGDRSGTGPEEEQPAHEVRVRSFALSAREVTRSEFEAFVRATDHTMVAGNGGGEEFCDLESVTWQAPGFEQTDEDPAVCVSWPDAQAYIGWLNSRTGLTFRLPTEAEWEYAARAGTSTPYWWGADHDSDAANNQGTSEKDEWNFGTAPVGRFPANPAGLHDMLGNVSEWVQDCWQGSYNGAPRDGSAWETEACEERVTRGGSWVSSAEKSRVAVRVGREKNDRTTFVGFRLAMGS
jgi:formylglycine-generating enzyme required for sulfatase activity